MGPPACLTRARPSGVPSPSRAAEVLPSSSRMSDETQGSPDLPRIDIHVHLAGVGTQGSGCWISPGFSGRLTFRALRLMYRITAERMQSDADQEWAAMLARLVRESTLDRAVALGFDGVYDEHGYLERRSSQMIVPPAWVFEACRRHPELIPGPSLNPHRRDALERLEECVAGGAALIKWLPITQRINPASPRIREFYEVLAAARLPLLIHMGGERTFATIAPELNDVRLLIHPLEAGVPVICAHAGTRILFSLEHDQLPVLRQLLRDYPHLWIDNSGTTNPGRYAHLPRLIEDPVFRDRMLYGSDFPVPANGFYFLRRLGPGAVLRLESERNPLTRDAEIKRALGAPEESFTRAATLLPGLDRWIGTPRDVHPTTPRIA
jgi:uncharacterized protein